MKDLEGRIKTNQELRRHVLAYVQNKKLPQQVKTAKNLEAFREQHRAELTAYQAAAAYFKAHNIQKLPSLKQLEAEREQLISEKVQFYEAYREAHKAWLDLSTAQQNLEALHRAEGRREIMRVSAMKSTSRMRRKTKVHSGWMAEAKFWRPPSANTSLQSIP